MAAPGNHPIPATILRRRGKWLMAIETGDIQTSLTSDGHAYPPRFGSPELEEADLDFELAEQLDEVAPDLYAQHKHERVEVSDYRAWLKDAQLERFVVMTYFGASPVEAMLRAGHLEGVKEALHQWGEPERRFARAYDIFGSSVSTD